MDTLVQAEPAATVPNPRFLKEAADMSDKDVEFLYGLAYSFHCHGRHGEAERLFFVLTLCDSSQPRFWLGLGACRQKLGRYQEALAAYSRSFNHNGADYRPTLHIAECLYALHYYKAACDVLDITQTQIANSDDRSKIEERISALRRSAQVAFRDADKQQPTAKTTKNAGAEQKTAKKTPEPVSAS